jgi:conjugative coupling factor TraD (TOL family)
MTRPVLDGRLRPAVELVPGTLSAGTAALLALYPAALSPVVPMLATWSALALGIHAVIKLGQAGRILRYRRSLGRLPRYVLRQPPLSSTRLFLGRGFRWDQRHCQRLIEARDPALSRFLKHRNRTAHLPAGGDPALHGVGVEDERRVWMPIDERVGHMLVLGTTRVGKTRFADLLSRQDISRGDVVIFFDPKGDFDILANMMAAAKRAGRLDQFHLFHLGFPEVSERYNPIGDFGRITEVASRIATQLPGSGNSAAFREFAWRFTNIVARALLGLGTKPTYQSIARYVTDIEPLLIEYYRLWLARVAPPNWERSVETIANDEQTTKKTPPTLRNRDPVAIALVRYARERGLYDPVADGLRSAFEYDRTYFDKLTASLLPLLEKLTTGSIGELLAPDYGDIDDPRPLFDWMGVIRQRGIVYVGLDALSDPEVAAAVGASMFADLTSVAGRLYKGGEDAGLPRLAAHDRPHISIHADEFSELVADQFIPMVNKAGGAGIQVTGYTQTIADIEAGIGNRAQADQILGNFNALVMLRVKNLDTARVLTDQLPRVRVFSKITESRATDNNDPRTPVDFTSQNADRQSEKEIELVQPADLMSLPKGQAFALIEGGRLYKVRLPLAKDDPAKPADMESVRRVRRVAYGITP